MSEGLIELYAAAVSALHRPLIVPALAAFWCIGLGMPLLGSWLAADRRRAFCDTLILLALCLLIDKPGEAFYWTAAAAAYLPTLGCVLLVVTLATDGGGWSRLDAASLARRRIFLMLLLLAAGSSELGAAFCLLLGVATIASTALVGRPRFGATGWVVLPAGLSGAAVLAVFAMHRGQGSDVMAPQSATFHHLGMALVATVRRLLLEAGGLPPRPGAEPSLALGLPVKLLLLLGLSGGARGGRGRLADFAPCLALIGAAAASMLSAYLEFGRLCCERHQTMRQVFLLLALFVTARALPVLPAWRRAEPLALALVVLVALRLPGLLHDWRLYGATAAAHRITWQSGRAPGPDMEYVTPPLPKVTAAPWRPPVGHYAVTPDGQVLAPDGSEIAEAMRFFGKAELLVQ